MKKTFTIFLAGFLLFAPITTFAAPAYGNALNSAGNSAGLAGTDGAPTTPVLDLVGKILNTALGLLGVVLFALTVYAGFLWMTAQGNEEQVVKAKGMLRNAIVGLIIVLAAYSIASFVTTQVSKSAGLTTTVPTTTAP